MMINLRLKSEKLVAINEIEIAIDKTSYTCQFTFDCSFIKILKNLASRFYLSSHVRSAGHVFLFIHFHSFSVFSRRRLSSVRFIHLKKH